MFYSLKYILVIILFVSYSVKGKEIQVKLVDKGNPMNIVLEKLNLLGGKLIVNLPDGFGLMSEEMLVAKYPSSNRPTLVYTNENGTINFAFNHTQNKIPKDKLPELLPAFVGQFNSIYPQIKWAKKETEIINGKQFVVLEFITPATDSKIYNIMYVTVLDGKMLMCTFNCLESQKSAWEVKAKKSLNSILIK